MSDDRNIVLTGVARGGTTLTCFLLNKLENVVALHEPFKFKKLVKLKSNEAIRATVLEFFETTRASILAEGKAISKNLNGRIPDNPFGEEVGNGGLRQDRAPKGEIKIGKKVDEDFLLCAKHPAPFTALLSVLSGHFRCFAIVRNPLSVLASWNSVDIPERDGHAPPAVEKFDKRLSRELASIEDRLRRQLHILSWYYLQYLNYLPKTNIISYEEIIETQGRCLAGIAPQAALLHEPLQSRNKNQLYNHELMEQLAEALLATDGAYWSFYSHHQVEALVT